MSQQEEYKDPILTPGNLRKVVQNLPGNIKEQHAGYEYNSDSDTFENEINELFQYTEVTIQLQEYLRLYEKEYNKPITRQDIILLLDQLEFSEQESRIKASKLLLYISLGNFTMNKDETKENRIENLISQTNLIIECGGFIIFYQKLQQSYDSWIETDLYLTLLYILLESQRFQYPSNASKKFKHDFVTLEPNLTQFLFSSVSKLREKLNTSFPIKKLILLLWKSILFLSGGINNIKKSNQSFKESFGLFNNDIKTKSTPQDLLSFQNEILDKYPGFIPPKFPIHIISPSLTLEASNTLSEAMGYKNASNQIELLYQTLFPPKSSSNNNGLFLTNKKHFMYPSHLSPTFVLPLTHSGSSVPSSIKEAGQVIISNMHISLSNYQIIQERSKGIQKWESIKNSKNDSCFKIELQDDNAFDLLERIYANVIHDFQNIIIVLLKLLLTSVNTTNNNNNDIDLENITKPENINLDYLEEIDVKRNHEIHFKAISGILLLTLKWVKSSHVLKFEYISQLLVDSGCLLLILKIIDLQEITDLVKAQTDVPYYTFFDYNINRDPNSMKPLPVSITNRRNMFWAINFLRVLQMLTKHKTHRIMLLAQYKSSAILKRMLRISHPVLELYTLKLLKSQVPYLGRKWRSQNMKIISAIYLNCLTVLKDDWISKINFDQDLEEGKIQEHNLRILTNIYHGERYIPSLLPIHDELSTENPSGPGFNGFNRYDLNEEVHLDQEFINNYEIWLESETFYNEEGDYLLNTATPYPNNTSISHEQLTNEINKLYLEQLNEQFTEPPTSTPTSQGLELSYIEDSMDEIKQDLIYNLIQVEHNTLNQYILFNKELNYSSDISINNDEDVPRLNQ